MKKYFLIIILLMFTLFISSCTQENDDIIINKKDDPIINYYEIFFMVDNEIYIKTKVEENHLVDMPINPTKEGYEFIEWRLNNNKFDFSMLIADNYYIDAYFEEKIIQEEERYHELFTDNGFNNGFELIYPDTRDPKTVRIITTTNPNPTPVWTMAQWWTKYDMQYASYKEEDGNYIYENESHVVKINPSQKSFYTKLLASLEYDKPRDGGENWPHILISQTFAKVNDEYIKVASAKKIVVSLDVNIIRCDNMMKKEDYNPNKHAAQFLWYFMIVNEIPYGLDSKIYGNYLDFMWFGIPIFDSRHPEGLESNKMIDKGFVGATNKLIYSMGTEDYIFHEIKMGEKFHIEIDVLPYIKDAWMYAKTNGALANCLYQNMVVKNMNIGWELPGTFDVESEISNLSAKVYF